MSKYIIGDRVWAAEKDRMKQDIVDRVLDGDNYALQSGKTRFGRDLFPAHVFFAALYDTSTNALEVLTAYSEAAMKALLEEKFPGNPLKEMTMAEIIRLGHTNPIRVNIFEAKPRR
jgi:hypothetical protein